MVGVAGFEPAAHWSQTSCATKLRYTPLYGFVKKINGAQTRNRTKDTGIFSPLLYLLSYLGIRFYLIKLWWAFRDLNPGPAGYEPDALTN